MAGTQIAASDSRAGIGAQAGPAASSGSSFHAALRILPAAQRQAMFQIYAFCRAVDDIADGDAPHAERLAALDAWRRDIDACYAGNPPAPLQPLSAQIRAYDLQQADFLAVIDGMTMDVVQDIRAPDAATLDLYCDRVASAVGRLAVRVFGLETDCGIALAHHLGRALQLTNILRDIDEDAAIGRLYLPAEALAAAGIATATPAAVAAHPALGQACATVAREAQAHYDQAHAIMARCPARQVRSPRIMAEVYHRILARLCAQAWRAPRQRVRLPRAQLLWIVLRHAIG
ncbi:phytoene synthase [Cupriavidus phytorum]|uniref:Phytoene synthase n=2 Tax=Cupriavidus TaxID=106589 RepID=A0A375C8T9_9BURK|nr:MULTISPECIES: presqualene diphosphate synthase HpnD [Cupriavidus]PZX33934.1 farnesyl-diphosphate farnesyltransferase [Cupriavidus alkaliphilus]SOY65558.1 phytoene synthase [Cupriavidus taiwanensis]